MGSEREVIEEEDHWINLIVTILKMKIELERLKRKYVEEMDALRGENAVMKRKLEIGGMPTVHKEHRNPEGSNAQTITRMEGENISYPHNTKPHTSANTFGMSS